MALDIDNIDKRILFELERNARIPDVKLAKIVKKSKDAVRYRIRKLEKSGIIKGYKTWIDMTKLGYRAESIYLTLLNLPKRKEQLIKEIINDKRTYWIGVAEGVWNIGITYFVKNNHELFEIKNHLLSKYDDLVIDMHVTSLVSVSVHEKIFLVKEKSSLITFTEDQENIDIDELSKKILGHLYRNSKANIVYIAEKCGTSIDVVRGRMRKMEKNGVIIRYTIDLDYRKIGYEFYKTFIYLKKYSKERINQIMSYAEKSDTIINIVKQIAPWDFEFILFTKNFQEYNNAISKFVEIFEIAIRKVETSAMSEDIIFPCKELIFE